MRTKNLFPDLKDEGETIASWGGAKLSKYLDGRIELRGGSKEDHGEAREWISLFWHEGVVRTSSHLSLRIKIPAQQKLAPPQNLC